MARHNVLGPQNYNKLELSRFWSTEINYTVNDHIQIRDTFGHVDFSWGLLSLLQSGAKVLGPDGKVSTYGLASGFFTGNQAGCGWENKLEAAFSFDTGAISHSLLVGFPGVLLVAGLRAILGLPAGSGQRAGLSVGLSPRRSSLLLGNENAILRAISPTPNLENLTTSDMPIRTPITWPSRCRCSTTACMSCSGCVVPRLKHEVIQDCGDLLPVKRRRRSAFSASRSRRIRSLPTCVLRQLLEVVHAVGDHPAGYHRTGAAAEGTGKEFGVKTAWLNGAVTSTVSVFRGDLGQYRRARLFAYGRERRAGRVQPRRRRPRAGNFEAEVTWLPSENWQLSANFTDLPVAKYLEYPGVPQRNAACASGSAPRQAREPDGQIHIQRRSAARLQPRRLAACSKRPRAACSAETGITTCTCLVSLRCPRLPPTNGTVWISASTSTTSPIVAAT